MYHRWSLYPFLLVPVAAVSFLVCLLFFPRSGFLKFFAGVPRNKNVTVLMFLCHVLMYVNAQWLQKFLGIIWYNLQKFLL